MSSDATRPITGLFNSLTAEQRQMVLAYRGPENHGDLAFRLQRTAAECEWTLDDPDIDKWDTGCGHSFTLNDGTPTQNGMAFCCYCGNAIKEVKHDA